MSALEIIELSPTRRIRVESDDSEGNPREDWDGHVTGFVGTGWGSRSAAPAVHDDTLNIERAHLSLPDAETVARWARIFHGVLVEEDRERSGYWFIAPAAFAANWPDKVMADELPFQAEIMADERGAYQLWADGQVVGVVHERRVEWARIERDGEGLARLLSPLTAGDTRHDWDEIGSIWGVYPNDADTHAEEAALENFLLSPESIEVLASRIKEKRA